MKCLIIGTGDMAHALANQFKKTPKDETMHSINIASPTREYKPDTTFHNTGVAFVPLDEGMQNADVILLCIPGRAMEAFLDEHVDDLKHALLIDVNNDPEAHEAEAFEKHEQKWVKGMNDIGAIDVLTRKGKSRPKTRMSAYDSYALTEAKNFAETALGFDVQALSHDIRKASEQGSIGKEWKHSAYIAFGVYLFFFIIVICTYFIRWPWPIDKHSFPVSLHNKVMSSTALTLFALSLIPGTWVRLFKAIKNNDTMYRLGPNTLWALSIRKHVGLMGLYFLFLHAVMSLIDFGPHHYYWIFYDGPDAKDMNLYGELSMMFAVISFSLFIITGIASLPSVGDAMNKAQFDFVYGPIVWLALITGQIHCVIIFFKAIRGTRELYGGIPHSTTLGMIMPWVAIGLKVIQMIACRVLPFIYEKTGKADELQTTQHKGSQHFGSMNISRHSTKSLSLPVSDEKKLFTNEAA